MDRGYSVIVQCIWILLAITNVKGQCPDGWDHYDQHCYHYASAKASQPAAKEACVRSGAQLLSIWSSEENYFIQSKMIRGSDAWLGLERDIGNPWTWLNGSQLQGYNKWDPEEPGVRETCARIRPDGPWYGTDCNRPYARLCKKAVIQVPLTEVTAKKRNTTTSMQSTRPSTPAMMSKPASSSSPSISASQPPGETTSKPNSYKSTTIDTGPVSSSPSDPDPPVHVAWVVTGAALAGFVAILLTLGIAIHRTRKPCPPPQPHADTIHVPSSPVGDTPSPLSGPPTAGTVITYQSQGSEDGGVVGHSEETNSGYEIPVDNRHYDRSLNRLSHTYENIL